MLRSRRTDRGRTSSCFGVPPVCSFWVVTPARDASIKHYTEGSVFVKVFFFFFNLYLYHHNAFVYLNSVKIYHILISSVTQNCF